jgi:hypothetical protein
MTDKASDVDEMISATGDALAPQFACGLRGRRFLVPSGVSERTVACDSWRTKMLGQEQLPVAAQTDQSGMCFATSPTSLHLTLARQQTIRRTN